MPAPACSTHPMITSPISAGSIPARAIASRITTAARSTADTSLNTPPNDPIGVRQALSITASSTAGSWQLSNWDRSRLQLDAVAKLRQRFGIREGVEVSHLASVHDVAHREFDDLAAPRAGDFVDAHDARRDVPRRGIRANSAADVFLELLGEGAAIAQPDEQDDALVAIPLLADHEAFDHLLHLLDLAINLGGADTDAAWIEHRVGAAVDDDPSRFRELDVVTVMPHAGVPLEIRGPVPGAIGVIPEP